MKPVDFRNATYRKLSDELDGYRRDVLVGLREYGRCTTRDLAKLTGIDILTVRPRITELVDMGLVRLAEHQPSRTEGVYRVATRAEWEAFRAGKIGTQLEMAI